MHTIGVIGCGRIARGAHFPALSHLEDVRIKYAISLFNEGLDSVKNVALLSGFSDPLYFSKVFAKSVISASNEVYPQKFRFIRQPLRYTVLLPATPSN